MRPGDVEAWGTPSGCLTLLVFAAIIILLGLYYGGVIP